MCFSNNALLTIIQLQSLNLYIQTSWFTYTVLLLIWTKKKKKRWHDQLFCCWFKEMHWLHQVQWGGNEIFMAIEDGLYPLAYDIHTIKYLQQCKISWSVKNTCKELAKLHQLICEEMATNGGWEKRSTSDIRSTCLYIVTLKPTC